MFYIPRKKDKDLVTHVAGYPRVQPSTFDTSFFLSNIDEGENEDSNFAQTSPIIEETITVKQTGTAPLPGNKDETAEEIPVYSIEFQTEDGASVKLENRFAFIGYGSNSSPTVLAKKFGPQKFGADKDASVPVLMTNVQDHSVVHSAFIGGAGSVPVTLLKTKGVDARISVSFYTYDQVERMNSSEPNYDVVRMDKAGLSLNTGETLPVRPCVYDSIWGALLTEDNELMLNECIPHTENDDQQAAQKTTIVSTRDAMKRAHDLYAQKGGTWKEQFNIFGGFRHLANNFTPFILGAKNPKSADYTDQELLKAERAERLKLRMKINKCMMGASIPRNLDGAVIQTASLTQERQKLLPSRTKKPSNDFKSDQP